MSEESFEKMLSAGFSAWLNKISISSNPTSQKDTDTKTVYKICCDLAAGWICLSVCTCVYVLFCLSCLDPICLESGSCLSRKWTLKDYFYSNTPVRTRVSKQSVRTEVIRTLLFGQWFFVTRFGLLTCDLSTKTKLKYTLIAFKIHF